jgi:hypothetical protein
MPVPTPMRIATLTLLVGGLACAKNTANENVGAARDTTAAGTATISDSAKANQTKSGVTDAKTGESTLGPGVTKTRPDQGQPVTSKGDTINAGVDSATTRQGADSSMNQMGADSSMNHMGADSSMNQQGNGSTGYQPADSASSQGNSGTSSSSSDSSSTSNMSSDTSSTAR